MWIIYLIIAVVIVIWIYNKVNNSSSSSSRSSNSYPAQSRRQTTQPTRNYSGSYSNRYNSYSSSKPQNITQCVDKSTDSIFQLDQSTINVVRQVQSAKTKSSATIRSVEQTKNLNIDLSWIANLQSNLETANTLKKNLEIQERTRLNQSKFHYYTSLHFRSMIAADFVHAEYDKAATSLNQIGKVIVSVAKKEIRVSNDQYNELIATKDLVKKARDLLLNYVQELNHKTHSFKIKIRDECGDRGREWFDKMDKH